MKALQKNKCGLFYIHIVSLVFTMIGIVPFILSYRTGYVSIVYGEDNSIRITVLLVILVLMTIVLIAVRLTEAKAVERIYEPVTYLLVILLTTAAILLLVDRVEAIGNCIIAPWDAGHGGEESCYLAFGAIGCWCAALMADIVGCFTGNTVRADSQDMTESA